MTEAEMVEARIRLNAIVRTEYVKRQTEALEKVNEQLERIADILEDLSEKRKGYFAKTPHF